MKTIYPNDDKPKNAFVKQEQRQNLFGAMPSGENEGENQLTNEAREGGDRACSGLCRARRKKAKPR